MSLFEFAGGDPQAAGRAALLATTLQSAGWTAVSKIAGAGLVYHEAAARPMVLIWSGKNEPQHVVPLFQLPETVAVLETAFGGRPELFEHIYALIVSEPAPYLAPGDSITSPNPGTVGCTVSWSGGRDGFVTAGHVAPTVSNPVFYNRTTLGTVAHASNPARRGTAPMADVSIVEFAPGQSFPSPFGKGVAAPPNSQINVHNGRHVAAGNIFAFCTFQYWPRVTGTYGDTYITTSSVSIGGDSGSAVTDSNGDVVGTLVGGSSFNSFIQDIRYQLGQASGVLAGISL